MNQQLTKTFVLALAVCAACGGGAPASVANDCGDQGGVMTRLPEGFCIDRTEVTRGAYFGWLDTSPATASQGEACTGNTDFAPTCLNTGGWGPDRFLDNPITCVDWCDAQAFCSAHGKRLCGRIGGGDLTPASGNDPKASEWFAACSAGGVNDYVFGKSYVLQACYETLRDTWNTTAVGSFTRCASPTAGYGGIFDLGGNAAEWENSCEGSGADARCRVRGGSYQNEGNGVRCDTALTLTLPRTGPTSPHVAVGFRCCAD